MHKLALAELVAIVDESIRDGRGNAMCIPWDDPRLDANQAIANCCAAFEAAGWQWNMILQQLEKGDWYAWFRSQGVLSSPIIQWGKVSTEPKYVSPHPQFSLF